MTEPRAQSATFARLAGDLLNIGMGFRFQARGRSMVPVISDSDILQIEPIRSWSELRTGDIVLFHIKGEFRVHRVIRKGRHCLYARGDASTTEEGPITYRDILGRVTARQSAEAGRVVTLGRWRERLRYFSARIRDRTALLLRRCTGGDSRT